MDPLGISASIVALLQLTGVVIQYINGVKGAPKVRQRLLLELSTVNGMLFILQDQAEQARAGDPWSSTLQSLDVPDGPLQQFQAALEILKSKLMPVEGWRKLGKAFTWPFESEEIDRILETIERQRVILDLAQHNDHFILSKAIKNDVKTLHCIFDQIGKTFVHIKVNEDHERLRRWLSAPDPSTNYNKALSERHKCTGKWFLESSAFIEWKREKRSFLWLYGIPGCGKTILSSSIVEDTLRHCEVSNAFVVLYFYFDFNDAEKQRDEDLLRSLVSQLCLRSSAVPAVLESLYMSCMNGARQPSCQMLLATLLQMMTPFEEVFIIIDALDEAIARPELLAAIEEIFECEKTNLHILITSRREKDIEGSLERLGKERGSICIQGASIVADVRHYVHHRLQADNKLRRWREDPQVLSLIEHALLDNFDGMFQWVACQLRALGNCLNLAQLRKALVSMPKTLDGTYARILCNIDKEHSQYALKLLQWLTYSARPLQIRELAEVLAIDVNGSPRFDPERRFADPQDILELCPSLIILGSSKSKAFDDEARTKYIALAHFSVKEYLISERIKEGPARSFSIERLSSNRSMAEDCLAYLLQFDQEDSLTSGTLDLRLARYAARFWTLHARVAELGTNTAVKLSMELFRTAEVSFLNWLRLHDPHKYRFRPVESYPKHVASPLYYASRAGLPKSVEVLLGKGADVNEQGGEHGDALSAASYYGHERVVDLLIRSSAHINSRGGVEGNALLAASLTGHEELVRLLIRHGADVNHRGGRYNSALQAASFGGFAEIGQLLLDHGAQVNAQGGFYGSALLAALVQRREAVIQLLIAHNADPSLGDIQGINALHYASALGRLTLLDIFSTRGFDFKIVDKQGRNCLHHAASRMSQRSPKWLLQQGMNLDLPDRDGWTALHWAAKRGNSDTIKSLIEAGAVLCKENINGWTPYDVAMYHHGPSLATKVLESDRTIPSRAVLQQAPTVSVFTSEGEAEHVLRLEVDCDGCFMEIRGSRFMCVDCPNFDYCFKCNVSSEDAHPGHSFVVKPTQNDRVERSKRYYLENV